METTLLNTDGQVVHGISYAIGSAGPEGWSVVF